MKNKNIFLIALIFLLMLCKSQVYSKDKPFPPAPWPPISVKLELSCKDNNLYTETIQALYNSLKTIDDVYVSDNQSANFIIRINVMEAKNEVGSLIGVIYSTVIMKPFDNKMLIALLPKECFEYKTKKKTNNKKTKLSKEDSDMMNNIQQKIDKWDENTKDYTTNFRKVFWLKYTNDLARFESLYTHAGARNEVRSVCQDLILMINAKDFQKLRQERYQ